MVAAHRRATRDYWEDMERSLVALGTGGAPILHLQVAHSPPEGVCAPFIPIREMRAEELWEDGTGDPQSVLLFCSSLFFLPWTSRFHVRCVQNSSAWSP